MGLFKTNYSSALLNKISKDCVDAGEVVKRLEELEKLNKSSSFSNSGSGSESSRSFTFKSSQSVSDEPCIHGIESISLWI